ncbi:unnamed protein product [Adineta ricciae]|uniref:Uncharacterized protein n=1 Tax=Adineta ricciae TaxID=249248 RepID=A0A814CIQ1_ADIRI|nr:unnamed protein product [Adineta ricciae]
MTYLRLTSNLIIYDKMHLKDFILILFITFLFNDHLTTKSHSFSCPTNDPNCSVIKNEVKPVAVGGGVRRLFFLFLGCLLTTCLIIAMIVTYNRITNQQRHQPLNLRHRFRQVLQSIGWNNVTKRGRFPFFSTSSNNPNTHSSGTHRQGETSRAHLNENQDEALLFDDPYADGGIAGGLHGSSTNPYKSLTLSVT